VRDGELPFSNKVETDGDWPGNAYCIQQINLDYLKKFNIDVEEYTGSAVDSITDSMVFPFRY
jgi:hypothetical protein